MYADGGYQGPGVSSRRASHDASTADRHREAADTAKGFVVLPKRWVVERTIAWLNRRRRLAKDWACHNRKALAFLHLASIRLMLRRLCQKTI